MIWGSIPHNSTCDPLGHKAAAFLGLRQWFGSCAYPEPKPQMYSGFGLPLGQAATNVRDVRMRNKVSVK